MSKVDEDITNQVSDVPPRSRLNYLSRRMVNAGPSSYTAQSKNNVRTQITHVSEAAMAAIGEASRVVTIAV